MRKFIAIALVFTMALGLTACAGGGSEIHRLNMAVTRAPIMHLAAL